MRSHRLWIRLECGREIVGRCSLRDALARLRRVMRSNAVDNWGITMVRR